MTQASIIDARMDDKISVWSEAGWRFKFALRIRVCSTSRDLKTGKEFAVAVRSEDRRVDDAHRTHHQAGGEGGNLFDDALLGRLVAYDAALPDFFTPDFELRFGERDHKSRLPGQRRNDRKDFGQG